MQATATGTRTKHRRRVGAIWSRAAVIAAIRTHVDARGRPPAANEWRLAAGKSTKRGVHPQAGTVRKLFGSFDAAVVAAGFDPYRPARNWPKDEVIAAMRAFADTHGRPPTSKDWRRATLPGEPTHPGSKTVAKLFGSFAAAVTAAGLVPASSDERVVALIRAYVAEHGQPPSSPLWEELRRTEADSRPSASTLVRHHGSWAATLALAGFSPAPRIKRRFGYPSKKWTETTVAASLRTWAEAHGRPPRHNEWRYAAGVSAPGGAHPNAYIVCRLWGSWQAGLAAVGLAAA